MLKFTVQTILVMKGDLEESEGRVQQHEDTDDLLKKPF